MNPSSTWLTNRFKVAGVGISICSCILGRAKIALPPPGPPMSADEAVSLIESSKTTVAFLAPSTLDDIGKQPRLLERMRDMKALVIGGGAISKAAGDAIITKTKLLNFIGLTEIGALSQIDVDPEDWAYIQPSPVAGVEFRHFIGESYELVIVRNEKDFANGYQPTFKLFPDSHEFATHDLFFKHPTKPNHWLWSGRSDDVIVFLNGEKTNPVTFEGLVQSLPQVRAALVTGQGRFEAALLIEPADSSAVSSAIQKAQFIEKSWPTIEEANRQCPAHAKVSKSHILFTKPEKPMSRAGKGTVQRRFTIDSYATEIEALYADVDTLKDQGSRVQIDVNDLEQSLVQLISKTAGIEDLVNEEDFFARGMDSLQVIWTTRDLKAGLEGAGVNIDGIAPSIVYINPTVSKLASAIRSLTHESKEFRETEEKDRAQQIEAMIEKYSPLATQRTQTTRHQTNGNIRKGRTVVLTGSTGGLGSYLLQTLLDSKFVSRVYCLNRAVDSEQRQIQVNGLRGLRTQWDIERVVFLTSDFTKEKLGLEHATFQEILANMDILIHNAWTVDFNLSLASYEPHLQGLKNIVAMANASAHHASLFFISSIASVLKWPDFHSGPVPEQSMQKINVAQPTGYGESKHAAERILIKANENLNIPVSICRVGQIAGPVTGTKGMWSKQEWLPSLLLSSQHLGVVPDDLGGMRDVDWIPIDELSTILVELALASSDTAEQGGENVFHTVNPSTTTWAALLPTILEAYGPNLKTVSLAAWVKTLRTSAKGAATEEAIRVNPAIKLLNFYEGLLDQGRVMPRLDTRQTEKVSPSLGALGPVRSEWMAKWIEQWKQSEED